MNANPVIIIGAGWAGLAAAVKLTKKGLKVVIYESAKQAGGRARSVKFNSNDVDNGQHLLIGAYSECFNLMGMVGIDTRLFLKRLPLQLTVIDKFAQKLILSAPPLPAPLHLLYALLTAKGLQFKDRIAAIRFGLFLKKNKYKLKQDVSVQELFQSTKQTDILIRQLWEPLCLATMNTPITKASANIFMRVFKDAFTNKRKDADLLIPTVDLSSLFPHAAIKYIEDHGGEVHLKSRVEKLDVINSKVTAIRVKKENNDSQSIESSNVIIATAPQNLKKLTSDYSELETLNQNIEKLHYEPIVTVYLQYPEDTKLTQPMIGMSSTLTQWVFDRGSLCRQAGLMSIVISSEGKHMGMDDDTLIKMVHNEIAVLFSNKLKLQNSFVIREKRATFSCEININDIRPKNSTPITGLTLAGDYTDTQYPATLEGAIRSGLNAAEIICNSNNLTT